MEYFCALALVSFEQKNDIFLPIINMISGCFSRKKSALQATPGTGKAIYEKAKKEKRIFASFFYSSEKKAKFL